MSMPSPKPTRARLKLISHIAVIDDDVRRRSHVERELDAYHDQDIGMMPSADELFQKATGIAVTDLERLQAAPESGVTPGVVAVVTPLSPHHEPPAEAPPKPRRKSPFGVLLSLGAAATFVISLSLGSPSEASGLCASTIVETSACSVAIGPKF